MEWKDVAAMALAIGFLVVWLFVLPCVGVRTIQMANQCRSVIDKNLDGEMKQPGCTGASGFP